MGCRWISFGLIIASGFLKSSWVAFKSISAIIRCHSAVHPRLSGRSSLGIPHGLHDCSRDLDTAAPENPARSRRISDCISSSFMASFVSRPEYGGKRLPLANFNPCEHEQLTEQQWERAFEIFEQHRGIPPGQARVVYEHEKEGRTHQHVIWSRIVLEEGRAWSDALDAKICHATAREIERELGLERTISPLDKDRGGPRPLRAPKSYEMFRGIRSDIDPRDVTKLVVSRKKTSVGLARNVSLICKV